MEISYFINDGYGNVEGRPHHTTIDPEEFDEGLNRQDFEYALNQILWDVMIEKISAYTDDKTVTKLWEAYKEAGSDETL